MDRYDAIQYCKVYCLIFYGRKTKYVKNTPFLRYIRHIQLHPNSIINVIKVYFLVYISYISFKVHP